MLRRLEAKQYIIGFNMATYLLASILALQVLTPTLALQVTPNSGCASVCVDYAGADPSDPNVSNTYGSDIVCNDADYSTTAVGQKFQTCINCLQNSTATGSGETDESWFLYNIRFAFNTCMFNSANASDVVSTPCILSSVCSPLQGAMESEMDDYSVPLQYSYCSANGTTFASTYFDSCQSCLRDNDDTYYLSNFLTALLAGCSQQPANGSLLGLNGTLFEDNQVQIVAPIVATPKTSRKILTRGAITGIVVAGIVVLLITAACAFICTKKRQNRARLAQLQSPLHSRFGAENISAPSDGAWTSPDSPPMRGMYKEAEVTPPYTKESFQMTSAPVMRNFSFSRPRPEVRSPEPQSERTNGPSPKYTPSAGQTAHESFPTHQAYIPQHTQTRNTVSPQPLFSHPPPQGIPNPHPQRFTPSPSSGGSTTPPFPPPPPGPPPPASTRVSNNTVGLQPSDPRGRQTLGLQISAPVVRVGPRFESEDEARKARERLYRQGLGATQSSGQTGQGNNTSSLTDRRSIATPSSAVSEELWPGRY